MVAMLWTSRRVHRARIHSSQVVHFYVGCDASPQGGLELFCGIVVTIINGDPASRHVATLPITTLGYGRTSGVDKAMGLLWALWLKYGPDVRAMEFLLANVRGFLCDFGVEHIIGDMRDIFPAFMSWVTATKGGRSLDVPPAALAVDLDPTSK